MMIRKKVLDVKPLIYRAFAAGGLGELLHTRQVNLEVDVAHDGLGSVLLHIYLGCRKQA
jgi:hypothetical protein